ncbi:uncharacterized protein LOC128955610 [Oppia nitens]|uniref:uncharacterized protein LOC128955610 n=1 Tax=Oppia nitens TaxID=1686743 RepID=UPI0023D99027|nr:uncharacterized protein LOC128955610 [Oppia nitens]
MCVKTVIKIFSLCLLLASHCLSHNESTTSIIATDGVEVEDEVLITTETVVTITESEVEFINKSMIETTSDVKPNEVEFKVNTNEDNHKEVENSAEDSEDSEDSEDTEYDDTGDDSEDNNVELLDKLLIKGPTDEELPLNSTPEKVYDFLWQLLSKELDKEFKKVMPALNEYGFILSEHISQNCFIGLTRWASRLQKFDNRAVKYLDASGKLVSSGLLEGTLADLGNFDQCIGGYLEDTESEKQLNGKYCLVRITPPLPPLSPNLRYSHKLFNFTDTSLDNPNIQHLTSLAHNYYSNVYSLGVCIVSDCEANDINMILNHSLSRYQIKAELGSDCYTGEKITVKTIFQRLDFYSIISIAIISGMCGLVGLATGCELFYNLFNDKPIDIESTGAPMIMCFSLISNLKKLYSLKCKQNDKQLQSINGLKVIAIVWIVMANVYLFGYQPQIRALIKSMQTELNIRGQSLPYQLILNSWNSSQIFFLIGGFLTAFTTTTYLTKTNRRLNFAKYIGKRLVRLLPPIILPLTLVFLMPVLPNGGPVYNSSTERLRDACAHNWWQSLLLISNLLPENNFNNLCLPHLWFISVYFQLNLISLIVLFITYNKPKLFRIICTSLIIIGVIFPIFMTFYNKLSLKSSFIDKPIIGDIATDLRLKNYLPFNHFSSYFIGVSIGVYLSTKQKIYTLSLFGFIDNNLFIQYNIRKRAIDDIICIGLGILVITLIVSIFGYLVFEAPFLNLSKRILTDSSDKILSDAIKRSATAVDNHNTIIIKLDDREINGNNIIGDKFGANDDCINARQLRLYGASIAAIRRVNSGFMARQLRLLGASTPALWRVNSGFMARQLRLLGASTPALWRVNCGY